MSFFLPPTFLPLTFNFFPSAFFILSFQLTAMSYELSIPSYLFPLTYYYFVPSASLAKRAVIQPVDFPIAYRLILQNETPLSQAVS